MELELKLILEAWKNKLTLDFDCSKEIFNLYIDSPFCSKKCRFCCYNPTILKKNNLEIFKAYYSKLLPQCIDEYSAILNVHEPNTVYFGGGTSSLMSVTQMKSLFRHLQQSFDFKNEPKEKTFEINPLDVGEEKISLLSEWNFTHVTMGVQSFDQDVLKYNNRINPSVESIKNIAYLLEKYQLMYNMDLMAFVHKGDLTQDMNILSNDLEILENGVKPLHITIYPNYFYIDQQSDETFSSVVALRNVVSSFLNKGSYIEQGSFSKQTNKDTVLKNYRYGYSMLRKDLAGKNNWKVYSCSGWPNSNKHQNVLGLGGYGKRKTTSYFGDKFCYQTSVSNKGQTFSLLYAKLDY